TKETEFIIYNTTKVLKVTYDLSEHSFRKTRRNQQFYRKLCHLIGTYDEWRQNRKEASI
ncbi:hypothetical protein EG68_07813, partial [Paragonimus skrjabini miyazakii]